ncbi:MAG: pyridoxal-phosphate dependent enzyme [Candidatus Lokiarchaeota archaeon]|nr:pyridoxal-phosphate dependent enzyme [Candidatus Lokiarchaeota archaeon]
MLLKEIPRISLANLPTPIEKLVHLGDSIGIDNLWVKRDDLTENAAGGNKIRKLEYIIADALEQECDTVITIGAIQSNHCRQTAAAAAKAGIRCILLLAGEEPESDIGNLLLDKILGAEVKFYPDDTFHTLPKRMDMVMETLRDFGLNPYAIPAGGSTPLGCLGYISAMEELKDQMISKEIDFDKIIVPVGTGGTYAGMILGAYVNDIEADIIGISALYEEDVAERHITDIINRMKTEYPDIVGNAKPKINIDDRYLGTGYKDVASGVASAIDMFGKMDALLLDPIYTGRAGLALMRMALNGEIESKHNILFYHTGGTATLSAYASKLWD